MGNYEIDFYVDSMDGHKYGIEVKSGRNYGKSICAMNKQNVIDYVVYFKGDSNYGKDGNVITVPLCMAYKFKYCFDQVTTDQKGKQTVSTLTAFDGIL